jgi:LacI family transcriptional regulator
MPRPSAPKGRVPTIRDVAAAAGVGLGTVSRVINGHPNVGAELRLRVQAAVLSLGFAPDAAAQTLRSRHSRTFACVVRDLTVPVLASFAEQMQAELDRHGYGLLIGSSYHSVPREKDLLPASRGAGWMGWSSPHPPSATAAC